MALVNPYCTVAQVQAIIKNTSSTLTAEIENAINAASRFVDDYKGRDYLQHLYESGSPLNLFKSSKAVCGDKLFLPYLPIITSTQLTITESGVALVANTDYIVFTDFILRVGQSWEIGDTVDEAIVITGKFGYSQTSSAAVPSNIPGNITQATMLIAANLSGHNSIDMVSAEGERQSVIMKNIPKEAIQILGVKRIFL